MHQGKLSIIAFLLFVGIGSYLLASDDEGDKHSEVKEAVFEFSQHDANQLAQNNHAKQEQLRIDNHATLTGSRVDTPQANTVVNQTPKAKNTEKSPSVELPLIHMLEVMPKSPIYCNIGMKIPLIALNIDPINFAFDDVNNYTTWHTTQETIATVSDHELHCLSEGNSELIATVGSSTKKIHVSVMDSPITSLSLNVKKVVEVGGIAGEVTTTLHFANGKQAKVMGAEFAVSDPSIASIASPFPGLSLLQTMRMGEVRIDAYYLGLSAHQYVTITAPKKPPRSIHIAAMTSFDDGRIKTRPIHTMLHKNSPLLGVSWKENGTPSEKVNASLLEWTVSDPSVISLEAIKLGSVTLPMQKVIAKKIGRAEVRVAYGALQATATVLVHASTDAQLKMLVQSDTIRVGDQVKTQLFRSYDEGIQLVYPNQESIQWRSSNSQVLSIDNDKRSRVQITAIGEGKAELYAVDGEQQASAIVHVSATPTGLYFDQPQLSLTLKQKISPQHSLRISYSDGYHRGLDYNELNEIMLTTGDSSILQVVNKQSVVATGTGTTQLHMAYHNFTVDVPVAVQAEAVKTRVKRTPVAITITTTEHELVLGSKGRINTKLTFDDVSRSRGGGGNWNWSSSNPAVIEVSPRGVYRALAPGEAEISVWLKDSMITDKHRFVVPEVLVESLSLEQDSIQLPVDGTYKSLPVWALSPQGERKNVSALATFIIEDQTIAEMSNYKNLKAKKSGSSLLRVRYAGKETALMLYVYDDFPPAKINCSTPDIMQMMVNESNRIRCSFSYQDPNIQYKPVTSSWRVISSDPTVVITHESSLFAQQAGTASITIQVGQLRHQLQVVVSQPELIRRALVAPDQIKVQERGKNWSLTEYYGNSLQRKCTEQASSSNEHILAVSNSGTLRGQSVGQATLHVYCKGDHYQKNITVIASDRPAPTQSNDMRRR